MPEKRFGEAFVRLRSLLESRATSFWVIGAWIAITLVWLVPFQLSGQSSATITAIAEDWFAFRAVYVLVGVTTLLCAWARLSRDLKRAQLPASVHLSPTVDAQRVVGCDLEVLDEWLTSRRYTVARSGKAVYATRNRYSLLGGSLLHLGIVLFGVALVAHSLTVDSVTLRVTEGQSISEAATAGGVAAVPTSLRFLTLESIEPKYFEDVLLFTQLEGTLVAADGSKRRLSLSRPYWTSPTTVMGISDYNLAPHIEVTAPDGSKQASVVAMNLSPPGTQDTAELPGVPFGISMIAYPDYGVVDGRDVSLSYNIVDPAFVVSVEQGGRTGALVAREIVGLGEPVEADGYTVRIPQLSRYGTFRLTTAPALPFVALSLLIMTIGVTWRYVLRRHSVMAWQTEDGVLVDGWLDMGGRTAGREVTIKRLREAGLTT